MADRAGVMADEAVVAVPASAARAIRMLVMRSAATASRFYAKTDVAPNMSRSIKFATWASSGMVGSRPSEMQAMISGAINMYSPVTFCSLLPRK